MPTIDYAHVVFGSNVELYFGPIVRSGSNILSTPFLDVDTSTGATVTTLEGVNALTLILRPEWNQSGYIYTPAGGTAVTYRDQIGGVFRAPNSNWVYDPGWAGPDGARMSSIWGSAASCAQ